MPRKKVVKSKRPVKKTVRKVARLQRISRAKTNHKQNKINWTESYSSFLLGVVVIIVAVLFGVSIIRQQSHVKQTSSISTGPTITAMPSPTPGSTMTEHGNKYYIVKPNDSLWSIAIAVYSNGYKWVDIAQANNITNPDYIFTGDKLLLPSVSSQSGFGEMIQPTATPTPSDRIMQNSYTVKKGDDLWHIAIRAYGDGYQWVKIARANNLTNPDLIFSGNVLTLPR